MNRFTGKINHRVLQVPDRTIATRRAIRALCDWRFYSSPGDFARAVWIPEPCARAIYGADIPGEIYRLFPALLNGGDIAFLNCGAEIIVVMPLHNFQALAGAQ